MQASSYGFFLTLWICFSTVVKAQTGCSGSKIPKDLNNESPSNIKDIYSNGENLRLSCQTGYAGYLRIICSNGVWTISGRRRCDPKQCGHPGDTPHGDFILAKGDDFVFGSQVEYSCKKGYVLAGKINHRSCLDQGWDNTVPICEVVKCRPVQQTRDLIASGNTESPQYGDIIQFECKTDDKKIDGEKQIHCTDTGEWSASVPKCEEVTCTLPAIPNGWVTNEKPIYKRNEIISFSCNERYTAVGRATSTCTHHDWRPKPQCEETVCRVEQSSDIYPKTRAVYYPGESAEIVCKQSYRTSTKKQKDTVTCRNTGWSFSIFCEEIYCLIRPEDNVQWTYRNSYRYKEKLSNHYCQTGFRKSSSSCEVEGWVPPLCSAISCDPDIPNVIILSENKKYTIGERLDYKCKPYHLPEGRQQAYCRENGWEKKPDCKAMEGFCQRPDLDNGYHIQDKSNPSVIYYGCLPGYKPLVEGWWGELTCKHSEWSDNPKCIDETSCVPPKILNTIQKERKDMYSDGEFLTFECDDGYEMESNDMLKCVNGIWNSPLPVCKPSDKMCDPPPRVEYATITSKYKTKYADKSKVEFQCTALYEIEGDKEVTCNSGHWSNVPKCIRSACSSPEDKVNNAKFVRNKKGSYENGEKVDYKCEDTFFPEGETTAICTNGDWQYPRCIRKDYCEKPEVSNGYVRSPKKKFNENETLEYGCYSPCKPGTNNIISCKNGQWDHLVECTCPQLTCEEPPVPENGDILFKEGEGDKAVVTYKCKLHYKLLNETKVKCQEGKWQPFPVCLPPCVIENVEQYNAKMPREKYLLHGARKTLDCKSGYYVDKYWTASILVECEAGNIIIENKCHYYTTFG